MSNHVHLVAVPECEDSLAILLRARSWAVRAVLQHVLRADGPPLAESLLRLRVGGRSSVDRDGARGGGLRVVQRGRALVRCGRRRAPVGWWREQGRGEGWASELELEDSEATVALRGCTYAGRPFGNERLVSEIAERFGRCWTRGRPRKEEAATASEGTAKQFTLF